MKYFDRTIKKFVNSSFNDYPGKKGTLPFLQDFFMEIEGSVRDDIKEDLFLFFKHLNDGRMLLAFRMPKKNSHLILQYHFSNVTSVDAIEGEEAWEILSIVARRISPFFRAAKEYYNSPTSYFDITSTMEFRTGASRILNYGLYQDKEIECCLQEEGKTFK